MEFRGSPYNHQRSHVIAHAFDVGHALNWEMGTGKSYAVIHTAAALFEAGKIDALVVIAPKGVYRNWEKELAEHWPLEAPIVWTWGTSARREIEGRLRVFLLNVEAMATARGTDALGDWLSKFRSLLVVDESTSIKNHRAKRTKALVKLAPKAAYRRIMTGSPVTQSPLDLYGQLQVLDEAPFGFWSFYAFRNRYAELKPMKMGTRKFQQVVGYRNLDELKTKLAAISSRVLKEDCLDLPPKVYQRREVELTDEQRMIYTQMAKDAKAILESAEVTAPIALTQILRLHQIVCGFVKGDGLVELGIPNRRLEALVDVIEETSAEKVIVWAPYRWSIQSIATRLQLLYGDDAAVTYYGSTTSEDRGAAIERFQGDKRCRFFVGNPQTAGYGLTLTAASTVVYFANSWKLEERMQSEDRAHRIGQTRSVTYVDLVSPGTVDERILEALRAKRDIANEVLGEAWREWIQ